MTTAYSFAELLGSCRRTHGMSQRQLAEAVGIPPSSICAYESGRRQPGVQVANQILDGLGLQLVLSAEPRDADLDRVIDEAAGLNTNQRIRKFGPSVVWVATLLQRAEPLIDGPAAALLHGLPIGVTCTDLRIHTEHLDYVAGLFKRQRAARWVDRWNEYDDWAEKDPREPGAMKWRTLAGEMHIVFEDKIPDHVEITVTLGRLDYFGPTMPDEDKSTTARLRVIALDQIGVLDTQQARLVDRVIERSRARTG